MGNVYEKSVVEIFHKIHEGAEFTGAGILVRPKRELPHMREDVSSSSQSDKTMTSDGAKSSTSEKQRKKQAKTAEQNDDMKPEKLAAKFSELYDDEWTEAFDYLKASGKHNDEEASSIMLQIICEIYNVCTEKAEEDLGVLVTAIKKFTEELEVPKDIMKLLNEKRKVNVYAHSIHLKRTLKDYIQQLLPEKVEREAAPTKSFIDKGIQVCWLMAIRDPPIYMDTDTDRKGDGFNTMTHTPYAKLGNFVDFVVWPTLFIHEGGNILSKGIAKCKSPAVQGTIKDKDSRSKPTDLDKKQQPSLYIDDKSEDGNMRSKGNPNPKRSSTGQIEEKSHRDKYLTNQSQKIGLNTDKKNQQVVDQKEGGNTSSKEIVQRKISSTLSYSENTRLCDSIPVSVDRNKHSFMGRNEFRGDFGESGIKSKGMQQSRSSSSIEESTQRQRGSADNQHRMRTYSGQLMQQDDEEETTIIKGNVQLRRKTSTENETLKEKDYTKRDERKNSSAQINTPPEDLRGINHSNVTSQSSRPISASAIEKRSPSDFQKLAIDSLIQKRIPSDNEFPEKDGSIHKSANKSMQREDDNIAGTSMPKVVPSTKRQSLTGSVEEKRHRDEDRMRTYSGQMMQQDDQFEEETSIIKDNVRLRRKTSTENETLRDKDNSKRDERKNSSNALSSRPLSATAIEKRNPSEFHKLAIDSLVQKRIPSDNEFPERDGSTHKSANKSIQRDDDSTAGTSISKVVPSTKRHSSTGSLEEKRHREEDVTDIVGKKQTKPNENLSKATDQLKTGDKGGNRQVTATETLQRDRQQKSEHIPSKGVTHSKHQTTHGVIEERRHKSKRDKQITTFKDEDLLNVERRNKTIDVAQRPISEGRDSRDTRFDELLTHDLNSISFDEDDFDSISLLSVSTCASPVHFKSKEKKKHSKHSNVSHEIKKSKSTHQPDSRADDIKANNRPPVSQNQLQLRSHISHRTSANF